MSNSVSVVQSDQRERERKREREREEVLENLF